MKFCLVKISYVLTVSFHNKFKSINGYKNTLIFVFGLWSWNDKRQKHVRSSYIQLRGKIVRGEYHGPADEADWLNRVKPYAH
ncbi:hypothetical protein MA16_Dca024327 [Dendrobium catenatum]|uniref:Uncharacterized protein n=1 Tax=Dendrobium catenatum TaxID=906689 RepID=A0A2I0XHD7_9ASPA|nr:hypothetical protein MA16_Dca024327 [Dendrobium catenatum]